MATQGGDPDTGLEGGGGRWAAVGLGARDHIVWMRVERILIGIPFQVVPMRKPVVAILLLLAGLAAYGLFRPNLVFFHWAGFHNPHPIAASGVASRFFGNHFSDMAWCAAAFVMADLFRERGFPPLYTACLLALPFLSEVAQAFHLIPGTFDWLDLLSYAVLLPLFFRKEVKRMRPIWQHLAGGTVLAVFIGALIGSGPSRPVYTYDNGVFTIPQAKDEVWTKPSLAKILQTAKNPAIVLRVPISSEKVTEEQLQKNNWLYSTIEKDLAKAGFIVRDRGLFTKVLDQGNLDYTKIGVLTQTDLILELVRSSTKIYPTQDYKDAGGAMHKTPLPMVFTGASIEFKLVSVKDNDLIGSYVFHYTPCTDGCYRRFSPQLARSADVPMNEEEIFKSFAMRLIAQLEIK
jgi:hypothetical protein